MSTGFVLSLENELTEGPEEMAAITVARLEERVNNHIKFFWAAVGVGFLWMSAITGLFLKTNSTLSAVATSQANMPSQVVAALLNTPVGSPRGCP
jgi:hypothetical protein